MKIKSLVSWWAVLALAAGLSGTARAEEARKTAAPAAGGDLLAPAATESDTAKSQPQGYIPGLGEFMGAVQLRHAKLWFAGKGKNWQLAAYELDELKEAFEDAATYKPEFEGKPIAKLIESMTAQPIARLEQAIAAKDPGRFARAYDSLSRACSACHQATDHGFIAIQRPTVPPLTNQRFKLGRQP